MAKQLTQPIKWHGGKHYLARWIRSHFPSEYTHYVEPYFGGGSVLLAGDGDGVSEVANDLNGDLACFWRVMANPELFEQFQRHVQGMPMAEQLFDEASAHLETGDTDPVSRAAAFFVCARQSRQGLMKHFATLSRNRTRRGMNEQASSWLTAVDGLPAVHERLKRVVVLNRSAIDVIASQDGPNTLFYLDPPYLHSTRVTRSDYQHEMTEHDHAELLTWLAGIQGKFVLSGYPSELYGDFRNDYGWHRVTREIDNKASSKATKDKKVECLWMNYEPDCENAS